MQTNQMKTSDLSFEPPNNEINADFKLWNMTATISENKIKGLG